MMWSALRSRSLAAFAVCLGAACALSCTGAGGGGGGGAAGTASAGTAGSSGATGAGGTNGASGGTGGSVAGSGGATGSGGVTGVAGGVGHGGSSGTAGMVGAAGANGGGGATGTGGSTAGSGATTGTGGASGGAGTGATGTGGAGRGGATGAGGGAGASGGRGGATGGNGGATGGNGGAGGTSATCAPANPPTGGTRYCSNTKSTAGNYSYELWEEGTGSGCMTVYRSDAKFSATWTNVDDFLARMGLQFDQTKTPAQIGTISADFAEKKTGGNNLVYVGIYGWTLSPLREYYIIDDWGEMKPGGTASDGTPRTRVGTITVDGDTYDVWKKTRENKPNITGTDQTFDQYFSIRQNARQCGHISVSEHFSKWIGLGLQLGKLVETTLLVESQDSTGTLDFTTATVTVK
jgi:endo-1,4-beta-xylanase